MMVSMFQRQRADAFIIAANLGCGVQAVSERISSRAGRQGHAGSTTNLPVPS